jgi:very-short-patch-repair endonuclease
VTQTGRRPDLERRQERQDAFLAAFAKTGIASQAAKLSGIPGPQHYMWLRRDAAYAERFAELRGQTRDVADRNAQPRGPALGTRQGGLRGQARTERQEQFLEAIGRGLPVMAAAREVGMGAPAVHYQWLRNDSDYAERFQEAFERTADLRRAYISETLSQAAERAWSKPAVQQQRTNAQRKRRIAETGALEKASLQGPFLAMISEGALLTPAVRDAGISKAIHRQWLDSDPDYAAAFQRVYEESASLREQVTGQMRRNASAARWDKPGSREAFREFSREYWTPERREEFSAKMQERFKDPAQRDQLLAAARLWWDRPDSREINSRRMKRLWADPEYRERYQAAIDNPERRERLSEAAKAQWAALTPEERDAKIGNMHRAFKGGHKLTAIEAAVMLALNDRDIPHLVHKQVGRYVADILIPSLHLVIECDGAWFHSQRLASDEDRDVELRELGFGTLRLSEEEIKGKDWTRLDAEIARLSP